MELLSARRTPDGIINLSEAYVPLHAELCKHYRLLGPSRDAVRIGRNKYHMRTFCARLEIPIPTFQLTTAHTLDECARQRYPVVVKPAIGCSSTLVQRVDSHDDLVRRFPDMLNTAQCVYRKELLLQQTLDEFGDFPFVVEEMAGGSVQFETALPYSVGEISVESIAYDGRTTILAIHDAPVPSNGPFYEKIVNCTPTRIPQKLAERARAIVSRLHEALGAGVYVLHTEMRTFADDLLLLEFGVRIGGSSLYKSVLHSTGNDFIEILIQLSLGERPEIRHEPPVPTITHYIVPQSEGRIAGFKGMSKPMTSPYFRDLQLYDDVGDAVRRPPFRDRASGYFVLNGAPFALLEREALRLLEEIDVCIDPSAARS
jgi:biotin carboxylase